MKRWIFVVAIVAGLIGCKSLKEQQLGAYVGDSQTKIVYRNIGKNINKVPDARRVYFRAVEQAADAGYTLSSEATTGGSAGSDASD